MKKAVMHDAHNSTPRLAAHRTGLGVLLFYSILAAGIATVAIGLLALLGWVLGLPWLASFGANLIPMAPRSAVLFVMYGVAICLRARTPVRRRTFWISVAVGCLGALVALLLFVLGCLNMQWSVEHIGLNAIRTVGGAAVGHMSLVTAFCFLLASVSFLASLSRSATRPWRAALTLGAAGVLLGLCLVFLLASCFGVPLLYGGTFIPPALNTSLAFAIMGLALLALAARPATKLFGESPAGDSKTVFAFILIFTLLAAGIVTTGYIYYRYSAQRYRVEVERQLSAIAALKVGELTRYRNECLSDAALFFKNPSFSGLVRSYFALPPDTNAPLPAVLDWLGKLQNKCQYDQVRLLDTQCVTRLSVPGGLRPSNADTVRVATEVLRSGQIVLQDFYRHAYNHRVYLQVLVPILDEQAANRPLGVLVLRIDPESHLYPFIRRWPTPSPTAETLLIRREGNEVVFLNELRFQTNTALNLRAPLSRTTMPAVQAALGREGIMDGIDYRGVPVVAVTRTIPDSPWWLVARVDAAEVYAPVKARLWQVVILVAALLFGAGSSVAALWRQQLVRFYKGQTEAAAALRESEAKFRALFENMAAACCLDEIVYEDGNPVDYRVLDINPSFARITGISRSQAVGALATQLYGPEKPPFFDIYVKVAETGEPASFESYFPPIGKHLHVTASCPAKGRFSTVFTDITERKRAEEELQETQNLLNEVGRIARIGGWKMNLITRKATWTLGTYDIVGIAPGEPIPGPDEHVDYYLPEYRPLVVEAMRALIEDDKPLNFEAQLRTAKGNVKWCHAIAKVVREGGKAVEVYGTFQDITERKRAEEELQFRNVLLSTQQETSLDGILVVDESARILSYNRRFVEMWGLPAKLVEDGLDEPVLQFVAAQVAEPRSFVQCVEYLYEHRQAISRDELNLADGRVFDRYSAPMFGADAHYYGRVWYFRDITEHRRAEVALRKNEACLSIALETSHTGAWDLNLLDHTAQRTLLHDRIFGYATLLPNWTFELFLEHVLPEDRAEVDRSFRAAIAAQSDWNFECRIRRADGAVRWIQARGGHEQNAEGKPRWMSGLVQDITERKQLEAYAEMGREVLRILNEPGDLQDAIQRVLAALKTRTGFAAVGIRLHDGEDFPYFAQDGFSEDFLLTENTLIARAANGGLCRDTDGKISLECTCGLVIAGKTDPADALFTRGGSFWTNDSLPLLSLPPEQDPRYHPRNQCIHQGYASVALVPIRTQDGIVGLIQFNDRRQGCFSLARVELLEGIAAHIGAALMRKRAEAELQKMQKLQSVGALAGGIAHDFNNILLGLFGNISLAKDELAQDHPSYASLEEAEKSMSRAIRLTKQLLTFAKGGAPVKEDVNLGALVEEIARFDLSGSNVKLVYQQAEDLWLAEADKGQIQQVISNITINARQTMPNGGCLYITLENAEVLAAAVLGLPPGNYVRVSMRDEGAGIDPKVLDRIFDPYFTTKQTGSGLGLATAYSIIHKHGGHIGVVSELGKGTTFTFYLPASASPSQAELQPPAAADSLLHRPANILVMDDDEMICGLVAKMLSRCGFSVATAPGGQEAIAMYQQAREAGAPFDVVIMDLTIPGGIGGKEAIKDLLALDPQAKVIVSSGYAGDPVLANYADYGFKGIAAKPYTQSELREVLARVLQG